MLCHAMRRDAILINRATDVVCAFLLLIMTDSVSTYHVNYVHERHDDIEKFKVFFMWIGVKIEKIFFWPAYLIKARMFD